MNNVYIGRGHFVSDTSIENYILTILSYRFPLTRNQLNEMTSIPRTTLFGYLEKLVLNEQIIKFTIPSKKRGKPKIYYQLKTNI